MLCCSVWDLLASRWSLEREGKDETWGKAGWSREARKGM